MHTFVSFLFDDALIAHWVKPEWCRFLDRSFVEVRIVTVGSISRKPSSPPVPPVQGSIIGSLDKHRPAAERWLEARREAAFGTRGSTPRDVVSGVSAAGSRVSSGRQPLLPGPPMRLAEPRKAPAPPPVLLPPMFRAAPMPMPQSERGLADVEVRVKGQRRSGGWGACAGEGAGKE